MGKIIKDIETAGDKGVAKVSVLFDCGAGSSLIRKDLAEKLCKTFTTLRHPRVFKGVNGDEAFRSGSTCTIELKVKDKLIDGKFYVVERMPREIIVGVDFLQTWEITLDMKNEDFTVGVDPEAIEIA